MDERKVIAEYSAKLKSFVIFGYVLIGFGILYAASYLLTKQVDAKVIENALTGTFIAAVVGLLFLYMGNKKRRFIFYDDAFEYKTNKSVFFKKYSEIIAIKSFIEKEKKSSIIIIFTNDGASQELSSTFLSNELIIKIFNTLYENCKDNEEFECEDELNFLQNGQNN